MAIKLKGLDTLKRKLRKVEGTQSVVLTELLPTSFMRTYTNFTPVDDMMQQSGFKVESAEDLEAIPKVELDAFVAQHSRFASWEEMLQKGAAEHLARQLGLS